MTPLRGWDGEECCNSLCSTLADAFTISIRIDSNRATYSDRHIECWQHFSPVLCKRVGQTKVWSAVAIATALFLFTKNNKIQTVSKSSLFINREHMWKDFHSNNRTRLLSLLPENCMVCFSSWQEVVYSNDTLYPFRPESNFWYLTGISEPDCLLVLIKSENSFTASLSLPERDQKHLLWEWKAFTQEEAYSLSWVDSFVSIASLTTLLSGDQNHFFCLSSQQHLFPGQSVTNGLEEILARLRYIKTNEEIAMIEEATTITKAWLESVHMLINHWTNEKTIQNALIAHFYLQWSHWSFVPIVANWHNACVLHYKSCQDTLKKWDLLLIDCWATHGMYAGDITRCFPVDKGFTPRQQQVYAAVERVKDFALEKLRPWLLRWSYIQEVIQRIISELGELWLITEKQLSQDEHARKKYFPHGLSHSLGLDVHDPAPYAKDMIIPQNMVLTIEPGIYIAEEAIGVRLEDDVVITADWARTL